MGCVCCRTTVYKTKHGRCKYCNNTKLYTRDKTLKLNKATAKQEVGMMRCTKKSKTSSLTMTDKEQSLNNNITSILINDRVSKIILRFMQTHPDISIMAKKTTEIRSIKHIGTYGYSTCINKETGNTEGCNCNCHTKTCPYCIYTGMYANGQIK